MELLTPLSCVQINTCISFLNLHTPGTKFVEADLAVVLKLNNDIFLMRVFFLYNAPSGDPADWAAHWRTVQFLSSLGCFS